MEIELILTTKQLKEWRMKIIEDNIEKIKNIWTLYFVNSKDNPTFKAGLYESKLREVLIQ